MADFRAVLGPAIPRAIAPTIPASLYTAAGPSGARMPSGIAGLRVDLDIAAFNKSLDRYVSTLGPDVVEAVKKLALELLRRIQMKTPTRTGRLKASFHAVLPGEQDRYRYQDLKGHSFDGSTGLTAQGASLRDWIMGGTNVTIEAIVGTNVDYAIFIEAGHSRKAPNGMVAISVAEMTGALDQAVEAALNNASRVP